MTRHDSHVDRKAKVTIKISSNTFNVRSLTFPTDVRPSAASRSSSTANLTFCGLEGGVGGGGGGGGRVGVVVVVVGVVIVVVSGGGHGQVGRGGGTRRRHWRGFPGGQEASVGR